MTRALAAARLPLAEWLFSGTPDELMKRLGTLPLLHQPGERWTYHMSAEILGVLVARVSGKPFGVFLRESLFEPLGMNDTGFHVPESKIGRLATCYGGGPSGETVVLDDARAELFARPRPFESGAGGLLSTAPDLLAFGRMLLDGGVSGRERILSRPSLELMTTDQLAPEQKASSPFFPNFWDTRGWGLGLGIVTRRADLGRSAGTFGWDGAFGTSFWIDPGERLIGILMTQRRPDWLRAMELPTVVGDFWTAAYQAIDD
jgi:CubicO group peptidase (beta-lactamase class C family)